MTNYNERLDEILELLHNSWLDDDYDAKDPDATEAKQAIRQLIADEMMELLDRIESNKERLFWWTGGEYDKTTGVDMRAIEAERAKLAEWLHNNRGKSEGEVT